MNPCDTCLARHACQPLGREHRAGGVFVKEMDMAIAGMIIPQHAHGYEHISFVAKGAVEFEGQRFDAPHSLVVPAFKKHTFRSLVDDTLVLCIHAGDPEVTEQHQILENQ